MAITTVRRLAPYGTTIFSEITRRANERGAINLAQGFPDFDGPDFAREAAIEAIRAGFGQYARPSGLPDLASALAAKYRRDYGLSYDAMDEITVTSGATEAIFDAIQGLCEPGDEVILFEPFYDSYRAGVAMAGAVARPVRLRHPDWTFDSVELTEAFGEKTKLVLVNSPHNPTGKVFSQDELEFIASLCRVHDVACVTDEVYEHLVFQDRHVPMAALPGMRERTVTISSFGKTFSLTGWKIGWACAPPELTAAVRAAHQFVTFATATPLQHAAAKSLATDNRYYETLLSTYRGKRDYLARELARIGFLLEPSAGTYFLCADFRPFGFSESGAFCDYLIDTIGVAAIPPGSFYETPVEDSDAYVRFAFCKKDDTLAAAVERLSKLCVSR